MDRAADYQAKLDQIVRDAIALPEAARAKVLDQLREAAQSIAADLAKADPASMGTARLRALKAEVDRVMATFAANSSADVARAQRQMYTEASGNVNATVAAAIPGLAVHPVVDAKTLSIAQNYTADLITGLSSETAAKINKAIQRTALGAHATSDGSAGGNSMTDLVKQIGGVLEGGEGADAFSGYFSDTAARASSIAITEILRVHSLASMARISDLSSRHPGVMKEWLHIPAARVPRLSHELATGQTRPVDQPFDVAGEQLMYPRDPSGSPENTINCHCLVRPYVDKALLQPTDAERAALQRHGISVTTSRS